MNSQISCKRFTADTNERKGAAQKCARMSVERCKAIWYNKIGAMTAATPCDITNYCAVTLGVLTAQSDMLYTGRVKDTVNSSVCKPGICIYQGNGIITQQYKLCVIFQLNILSPYPSKANKNTLYLPMPM